MATNLIFLLGPAGAGKSTLSKALAEKFDYVLYEIDQWPDADGIDAHDLRREWNAFLQSGGADKLLDLLRHRAQTAGKQGMILSFPSMLILRGAHLRALNGKVRVVYLVGTEEQCRNAFLAREQQTGRRLDVAHWDRNNKAMFEFLKTQEAKPYVVEAFDQGGSRRSFDQVVAAMARHGR